MGTKLLIIPVLLFVSLVLIVPKQEPLVRGASSMVETESFVLGVLEPLKYRDVNSVSVSATVLTDVYPSSLEQRHIVLKAYLGQLGETDWNTWSCILDGESQTSNHDLYDKNPSSSAQGPFQILTSSWNDRKCGNRDSWIDNVECAVRIKQTYGFSAWEAYKNCK